MKNQHESSFCLFSQVEPSLSGLSGKLKKFGASPALRPTSLAAIMISSVQISLSGPYSDNTNGSKEGPTNPESK
jgi:hypothetical protein